MTAIELLKSTTEYEVLESFRNKVAKLEEKAQMYSEEDMKNAFECAREFDSLDGTVDIDVVVAYKSDTSDLQAKYITFEEWLEQFKKK